MSIFTSLEGGVSYPPPSLGGATSPRYLRVATGTLSTAAGTGGQGSSPLTSASASGGHGVQRSRTNCLLMSTVLVAIGVMVICGVMVVREYVISLKYAPASCRIAYVGYVTARLDCMHCSSKEKGKAERGAGACTRSHFPCTYVGVSYDSIYNVNTSKVGQLHTDSLQAKGNFKQCSYAVCLKDANDNNITVEQYLNKWRQMNADETFPCYFDKHDTSKLIEKKYHTKEQVIHSMLWPSLVIVVCGLLFARIELKRRRIRCKSFFAKRNKKNGSGQNNNNDKNNDRDHAPSTDHVTTSLLKPPPPPSSLTREVQGAETPV